MERWPSGLRQQFTKLPGSQGPLEFESLSLRFHRAEALAKAGNNHFMLIKKSEAREKQNCADCTIWEYEYPSKNFSYATGLINGRYPAEKRATNTGCEEVYYTISGSGIVHSEKGDFELTPGDLYSFEKGEIYWVEGKELFLALVNAPAWTPEQHKIVD